MLKLQKDIIIDFVDSAVSVGGRSVFEWVELFEKSIYDQGSQCFPKKDEKAKWSQQKTLTYHQTCERKWVFGQN